MNQTLPPAIFFGSGPVAAASLQKLLSWQPICAVVTKRTPPHHKEAAPVVQIAQAHGLPLLYANTKAELDALAIPTCRYGIVIDYGVIISQKVIDYFELGIINSHFSLLPEWRGADPITYAILSGQQATGVSVMRIDSGMDTGPLLATIDVTITTDETGVSLTNKLVQASDDILQTTLPSYVAGTLQPYNQPDHIIATYSQKLHKQDGILRPDRTATELARQVRAFRGWPTSRLLCGATWLTIVSAQPSDVAASFGELVIHNKQLYYGCALGSLHITQLQPAGKKIMDATAFLNGYAQKLSLQTIY